VVGSYKEKGNDKCYSWWVISFQGYIFYAIYLPLQVLDIDFFRIYVEILPIMLPIAALLGFLTYIPISSFFIDVVEYKNTKTDRRIFVRLFSSYVLFSFLGFILTYFMAVYTRYILFGNISIIKVTIIHIINAIAAAMLYGLFMWVLWLWGFYIVYSFTSYLVQKLMPQYSVLNNSYSDCKK